MKKQNFIKYILIVMLAFAIGSCSQEESIDDAVVNPIPDLNNPTSNFFKVNFNGSTFKATTFSAVKANGKFTVTGGKGTIGENIAISINGIAPGIYDSSSDVIIYNKSDATAFDYVSYITFGSTTTHTALVEITAVNTTTKRISGTFDFVGYWSNFNTTTPVPPINFTNGSFEMAYTE